jgi:hypothetical protein
MVSTSSGNAASIAITLCGLAMRSDCVFDASLVPETCPDRFVDLKELINKFMSGWFLSPLDMNAYLGL